VLFFETIKVLYKQDCCQKGRVEHTKSIITTYQKALQEISHQFLITIKAIILVERCQFMLTTQRENDSHSHILMTSNINRVNFQGTLFFWLFRRGFFSRKTCSAS
jgi:hypothetical protein